jgi:YesN/AraC family two-component response regulator
MFEVGYSDAKAFREVFRKITGMSPSEYRERYNKELV